MESAAALYCWTWVAKSQMQLLSFYADRRSIYESNPNS
jgi:hypothetical protein